MTTIEELEGAAAKALARAKHLHEKIEEMRRTSPQSLVILRDGAVWDRELSPQVLAIAHQHVISRYQRELEFIERAFLELVNYPAFVPASQD